MEMSDKELDGKAMKRRLKSEIARFTGTKSMDTIVSKTTGLPYQSVNGWLSERKKNPIHINLIVKLFEHYPGIDWEYVFLDRKKVTVPVVNDSGYTQDTDELVIIQAKLIKCMEENVELRKQVAGA